VDQNKLQEEITGLEKQLEDANKIFHEAQATILRLDGALQFAKHVLSTLTVAEASITDVAAS
jgi:hypothetical protein